MATFKDSKDREWEILIDAPKIKKVREATDGLINLGTVDGRAYELLASNPEILVDVLWVLCKTPVTSITPDDFASGLVGDAIDRAVETLLKAMTDFFPKRQRTVIQALAEKQAQVDDVATAKVLAKINSPELMEELQQAMDRNLEQTLQETLTRLSSASSLPDSSASTPKEEPSVNSFG